MVNNTFLAPLSPIQRSTPAARLLVFQRNETQIYNKFSPYDQAGQDLGSDQPYIYVKLTDSSIKKNLTKYDTQALPAGSLVRDVQRLTKFTTSGKGLLFIGKQILIQGQAAFDETRTYNVGSVIGSAGGSTIGSLVRSILPTGNTNDNYGVPRHIEGRGLLNFFVGSLLSTIGMQTNSLTNSSTPIPGTATSPLSRYVGAKEGGRYGLLRGQTAKTAQANWDKIWFGAGPARRNSGFLQSVMQSIASTTGLFSGSGRPANWDYRPEYTKNSSYDVYKEMFNDRTLLLRYTGNKPLYIFNSAFQGKFYNDSRDPLNYAETVAKRKQRQEAIDASSLADVIAGATGEPNTIEIPNQGDDLSTDVDVVHLIANKPKSSEGLDTRYANTMMMNLRYTEDKNAKVGLVGLYNKMFEVLDVNQAQHPMYNKSAERYKEIKDSAYANMLYGLPSYKKIPGKGSNRSSFSQELGSSGTIESVFSFPRTREISLRQNGPDYSSRYNKYTLNRESEDRYNAEFGVGAEQSPVIRGKQDEIPRDLLQGRFGESKNQSADLIFFYFYDLVNEIYIPFRATLSGIQDQNSADWDTIAYLGRADKLFVYRGFSRDVSFNFKVYANSIKELVPMWERIDYLVGLTRPSKYTELTGNRAERVVVGGSQTAGTSVNPTNGNRDIGEVAVDALTQRTDYSNSGFMYPPMIEFRIGDLYNEQPAVLNSVNVSVSEDATWETLRSDEYEYRPNPSTIITQPNVKCRQLPNIVDVSVQLRLIEKQRAETRVPKFGKMDGWKSL
jgi:hypothetical protein